MTDIIFPLTVTFENGETQQYQDMKDLEINLEDFDIQKDVDCPVKDKLGRAVYLKLEYCDVKEIYIIPENSEADGIRPKTLISVLSGDEMELDRPARSIWERLFRFSLYYVAIIGGYLMVLTFFVPEHRLNKLLGIVGDILGIGFGLSFFLFS